MDFRHSFGGRLELGSGDFYLSHLAIVGMGILGVGRGIWH